MTASGVHETCAICQKQETAAVVLRDWYWARHDNRGFWFCSFQCMAASELKFNPLPRYAPPDEGTDGTHK